MYLVNKEIINEDICKNILMDYVYYFCIKKDIPEKTKIMIHLINFLDNCNIRIGKVLLLEHLMQYMNYYDEYYYELLKLIIDKTSSEEIKDSSCLVYAYKNDIKSDIIETIEKKINDVNIVFLNIIKSGRKDIIQLFYEKNEKNLDGISIETLLGHNVSDDIVMAMFDNNIEKWKDKPEMYLVSKVNYGSVLSFKNYMEKLHQINKEKYEEIHDTIKEFIVSSEVSGNEIINGINMFDDIIDYVIKYDYYEEYVDYTNYKQRIIDDKKFKIVKELVERDKNCFNEQLPKCSEDIQDFIYMYNKQYDSSFNDYFMGKKEYKDITINDIKKMLRFCIFGVELECYWSNDAHPTQSSHYDFPKKNNSNGYKYSPFDTVGNYLGKYSLNVCWLETVDLTLSSTYNNRKAIEFVSPAYFMGNTIYGPQAGNMTPNDKYKLLNIDENDDDYYEGITYFETMHKHYFSTGKDPYNYKIDNTCGLHVHLSNMLINNYKLSSKFMGMLLTIWLYMEPLLMLFAGRESGESMYALYLRSWQEKQFSDITEMIDNPQKYSTINTKYADNNAHLEFRIYHATNNTDEIINWVFFLQLFYVKVYLLSLCKDGDTIMKKMATLCENIRFVGKRITNKDILESSKDQDPEKLKNDKQENIKNTIHITTAFNYLFDDIICCYELKQYYANVIKNNHGINIPLTKNNVNYINCPKKIPTINILNGGFVTSLQTRTLEPSIVFPQTLIPSKEKTNISKSVNIFKNKSTHNDKRTQSTFNIIYDTKTGNVINITPFGAKHDKEHNVIKFIDEIKKIFYDYNETIINHLLTFMTSHYYIHPFNFITRYNEKSTILENIKKFTFIEDDVEYNNSLKNYLFNLMSHYIILLYNSAKKICGITNTNFHEKYIKYKKKYMALKKSINR